MVLQGMQSAAFKPAFPGGRVCHVGFGKVRMLWLQYQCMERMLQKLAR